MAKARKSRKQRADEDEEEDDVIEAEPFENEEKDYDRREDAKTDAPGESRSRGFFQQFGDSLKAAGQTAEKYTRIGITMAELEKLRLNLRTAYQKLGEIVARCWDAAPDIGVSAHDSDVKEHIKKVNALRRQIREVEAKIRTLKTGDTVQSKDK